MVEYKLVLLPQQDAGLFESYNSPGGNMASMALSLSVLVLWPIGVPVNRWKGESGGTSRLPRLTRWQHRGPVCLR